MIIEHHEINLQTKGNTDILDITRQLDSMVRESGLSNGNATVFCSSSTSGVTTIEYESGCISDLERLFNEIIPENREYAHNSRWGDGNGHSHVRASLLGPSLTIPVINGKLRLGTWQQVIFVDFDVRARERNLLVTLIGEIG